MREFLGVLAFITLTFTLIRIDANSEVTMYECQKSSENAPYFIGLERDFNLLRNKLSSFKEEDCNTSSIRKDDWYIIKQRLKYRKY